MGWNTIRRLTPEDEARLIPRLRKFCKRNNIDLSWLPDDVVLDQYEAHGLLRGSREREILRNIEAEIEAWVDLGEIEDYPSTKGQRAQRARRVWQRAVREPRADFGSYGGYIGYR